MEDYSNYRVTLGWDGFPMVTNGGGIAFSRKCEDTINAKFYPNGSRTWPINPITGEKLPPETSDDYE